MPVNTGGTKIEWVDPDDAPDLDDDWFVQREALRDRMASESGTAVAKIIALLVLAQTLLVGAMVFGLWKLTAALGLAPKREPLETD